jgi:membrane-associated phospholipid phosphatase
LFKKVQAHEEGLKLNEIHQFLFYTDDLGFIHFVIRLAAGPEPLPKYLYMVPPLLNSSNLSFPSVHPVAAYIFFFLYFFPSLLSFLQQRVLESSP